MLSIMTADASAESIGRAACASGSLTLAFTCSDTKLTHIMKNMRSWNTMSSRGIRLGTAPPPP